MAYHVHTTPGLVVWSIPQGEADKFLFIFTRDLGMIGVSAKGIRLEKSKLRYATQDYSYGNFSVVRGKESWRLTGAEALKIYDEIQCVRIMSLVKRFVQGEEASSELFTTLERDMAVVSQEYPLEILTKLEQLCVYRMLYHLGYIKLSKDHEYRLGQNLYSICENISSGQEMQTIVYEINTALRNAHL